jgi:hypothetical protein
VDHHNLSIDEDTVDPKFLELVDWGVVVRRVLKLADSTKKMWNVFKQNGKFCIQKFSIQSSGWMSRAYRAGNSKDPT